MQLASPPPPEIEPSYAEVFYSEEFGYSDRMSSDFEVEQLSPQMPAVEQMFAPSSAPPPLSPPPSLVELPLAYAEEVSSPEHVEEVEQMEVEQMQEELVEEVDLSCMPAPPAPSPSPLLVLDVIAISMPLVGTKGHATPG